MQLKYIVFGVADIVFFPTHIDHFLIGHTLSATSAGFCNINYDAVTKKYVAKCFGESIGLCLKSHPDDSEIANLVLNIKL